MLDANQQTFKSCYRNRHHPIFHLAYLRRAKVCLLEKLIQQSRIPLEGARILDYGFGAGTFFYRCPKSASLHGVELDAQTVLDVSSNVKAQGYPMVDFRTSDDSSDLTRFWPDIKFDLIICSHVLEHVEMPEQFLRDLSSRLAAHGRIICLVPINEIGADPKHVTHFDRKSLERTCEGAGLHVSAHDEADEIMYWVQPHFLRTGKIHRLMMQALSLLLGVAFCAPGWRFWSAAGRLLHIIGAKPTQAGTVLEK